ncbi:hypothetical protein D9M73_219810 [compost metagenome]
MLAGELAIHFRLLHFQLGNAGIQRHNLVKDCLGFKTDIHRFAAGLVLVECVFGFFQVLPDLWQLITQELQALCSFGRGTFNVLPYIELGNLVERLDSQLRLGAFQ